MPLNNRYFIWATASSEAGGASDSRRGTLLSPPPASWLGGPDSEARRQLASLLEALKGAPETSRQAGRDAQAQPVVAPPGAGGDAESISGDAVHVSMIALSTAPQQPPPRRRPMFYCQVRRRQDGGMML